jgi:hypothetical protein
MSFGCQVWGPTVAVKVFRSIGRQVGSAASEAASSAQHAAHVFDGILDRRSVAAEGVHLDFLRQVAGLPSFSHTWVTLAEFGRQPMLVRWLKLATRLWERLRLALTADEHDELLASPISVKAFEQSIKLFLADPLGGSWAAEFLCCMHHLGVADPYGCLTVRDVLDLSITEQRVVDACNALIESWWLKAGAEHVDPRSASSDAVYCSTYRQWVRGPEAVRSAPHLKSFLTFRLKQSLIRFRVGGFPLRIATGRNEGSGRANASGGRQLGPRGIPRGSRTCHVCKSTEAVEDIKHFLLECPVYQSLRSKWSCVFEGHSDPASLLGQNDQYKLAAALHDLLQLRHRYLSG